MSIAVMMLLHKNKDQVIRLIKHLSTDFDVYVHIDKRSNIIVESTENVYVYKKFSTYWGSFNQIMATLFLFMEAYKKKYDRYLLISGQDLPIKSNKEIIDFFEGNNKEFIKSAKMPVQDLKGNGGLDRMTKYWPNWRHRGSNNIILKILFKNIVLPFFNLVSNIIPRPIDYDFYKGTNWINVTHICVNKILDFLEKYPEFIKRFKWTNCADEIFFQTIIKQFNELEIVNESLRYINWTDGPEYPKVFRKIDYENIFNSNQLFARKFDADIDNEIIEMIYKKYN